jgi:hypothetical protein
MPFIVLFHTDINVIYNFILFSNPTHPDPNSRDKRHQIPTYYLDTSRVVILNAFIFISTNCRYGINMTAHLRSCVNNKQTKLVRSRADIRSATLPRDQWLIQELSTSPKVAFLSPLLKMAAPRKLAFKSLYINGHMVDGDVNECQVSQLDGR